LLDVSGAYKVPANGGIYLGCCTVAVQRSNFLWNPLSALCILPAKQTLFGVDPTRLELVSSAMRERHEGLQGFSGACKTPANKGILMMLLFSVFQQIYSGCCTVAARTLRLLHPHKVRDDRYLASCLEATYVIFALGKFCEARQISGVGIYSRITESAG
jgi:hypothetical protein